MHPDLHMGRFKIHRNNRKEQKRSRKAHNAAIKNEKDAANTEKHFRRECSDSSIIH